jgi:[ribosomal protein S5]-alanine N-acetyltransferase
METYFLTSARAGFRTWTPADLPFALALWGDAAVTRYIDSRGRLDQAQVQERLLKEIAAHKEHGVQYWPAFCIQSSDFLGCCGLRPYRAQEGVYELGIHLCAEHWGKGYGGELAWAVINFAFTHLNLAALFAGHHPDNHASCRLLGKLGFRYTHHEFYPPMAMEHPSYILTREGWDKVSQIV